MFLAADSLTPGYDLFKDVRHGDISLLGRRPTKTFLLDDYLCREKTFVLKRTPNGINCFCTINYKNLFIANLRQICRIFLDIGKNIFIFV